MEMVLNTHAGQEARQSKTRAIRLRQTHFCGDSRHLDVLLLALGFNNIALWNEWRAKNATQGVDLRGADLSNCDVSGANLRNADLANAGLSGADLSGAELEFANLRGADLTGATLRLANLYGADLTEADLSGSTMVATDLINAYLRKARLEDLCFCS